MRKSFCFLTVFAVMHSFAQTPGNKLLELSPISLDGETVATITEFKKIETANKFARFTIKDGILDIRISGVIDPVASTPVILNLYVQEFAESRLTIFASQDSQLVQYNIEGIGSGLYTGQNSQTGYFQVNTKFKITATGYPSYILDIPIVVHINPAGNLSYARGFTEGTAYIYNVTAKKKVKIKKNNF